jgi:hypothetical protein
MDDVQEFNNYTLNNPCHSKRYLCILLEVLFNFLYPQIMLSEREW